MKIQTDFYTLIPFDNLLYIESYSSWDERITANFAKDMKQILLQNYKEKAWAALHDGRKWELGTPAIEQMLIRFANTPLTNTITHHAYVAGKSELRRWQVKKVLDNIVNFEAKIFTSLTDAEEWLSSFGYTKA